MMANLKIGDKAIPFNLIGVDDQQHALSDYADKAAVAVIFSCNHCPYVRAWEDRMIQIQADYADKGVQLIAINANDATKYPDDSFPKMKERAQEKGFNFPYLHDETQEIAQAYGAERTPQVFLFDQDGVLRYYGAIDDNYENPNAVKQHYLRDALDAVLAGQDPPVTETPPVGCTIKWK
jgi:peroxiredoxin